MEVLIRLAPTKPPRLGLAKTKYCQYRHGIGHNTENYWTLKDKIEELIQDGYLAQFVKRLNSHQAEARPEGNIHNIHIEQNSSTKEKHEHYQEKIIIVIITTPMQPKSNNEEKKKINKETTA